MNTKINPGKMISSSGYSIERLNRNQIRYQRGDKTVTIEVEDSVMSVGSFFRPISLVLKDFLQIVKARRRGLAVALSLVRCWDPPHNSEDIGEYELATIRDDIKEGLKFLGIRCSFE
jgi:hypothetical protein